MTSEGKVEKRPWWKSNSAKIYLSTALSASGDRMWTFAVGLYLVVIYPDSLQLTAIFGFAQSISAIVFGAFIGRWIDKTKRLRVAHAALIVQNASVVICAILLIVHLQFHKETSEYLNGSVEYILIVLVIIFGILADLASIATTLALEKDWIVVVCNGDERRLAKMNATMRSIDLSTYILAPILVGQLFTYGSHVIGAIVIGGWNIVSGVLEYNLLNAIYKAIPKLSVKAIPGSKANDLNVADSEIAISESESSSQVSSSESVEAGTESKTQENGKPLLLKIVAVIVETLTESKNGWKDYFSHPVRNAGLGLALVYMTVLGFDSITTGYAYSQGFSESYIGIMAAVGAGFGIFGSAAFPILRRNLGKLVTGNIGFGSQSLCLILCLVSIAATGSPFIYKNELYGSEEDSEFGECYRNESTLEDDENRVDATLSEIWNCNISIILLLIGIVLSRFGLWIADLSVVQIFQEEIPDGQRGVLNGVQGALNQSMNLIKFLIVIVLPNSDTFAYLIVVSWIVVAFGWVLFMIYSCKNRQPNKARPGSARSLNISIGSSAGPGGCDNDTISYISSL